MIDVVSAAGDDGFESLVRALAVNEQEPLAKRLDAELAEKFIKKPSKAAGR